MGTTAPLTPLVDQEVLVQQQKRLRTDFMAALRNSEVAIRVRRDLNARESWSKMSENILDKPKR